jgi:hypothetical protein
MWNLAGVQKHITDITARWARLSCRIPQIKRSGKQLADMVKFHTGKAFSGCDDALEPGVLSALPEIQKLQGGGSAGVDP